MGKNGLKLLDISARIEHKSKLDKSKDPTKFFVGSLTSRQMFRIMSKYGDNTNAEDMAQAAMLFVKFGLKDVKGTLGKGFKLSKDHSLGWECDAVNDSYLDTVPIELMSEIASWVTGMSKVGKKPKKV